MFISTSSSFLAIPADVPRRVRFPVRCLLATLALAVAANRAGAQPSPAGVDSGAPLRAGLMMGSYTEDRHRVMQLLGMEPTGGYLLRSFSSTGTPHARTDTTPRWLLIPAYQRFVHNSKLPFTQNDGPLWSGRGMNTLVGGGVRLDWRRLHVTVSPELAASANADYAVVTRFHRGADTIDIPPRQYANPAIFPPIPGRSPLASPFHRYQSIDLPIRMGERPIARLHPGQTSAYLDVHRFHAGVAWENGWWGPALQNPLVLSNNAPGFPHVFLRTAAPWMTPAGAFEMRWLVGTLHESGYFDFVSTNDVRSISMLGLTWQPVWQPTLTVGAARSVYAAGKEWWSAMRNFTQVFADVGMPNDRDSQDPGFTPGRDQIFSLFFRWVLPDDGAEVYGEWGRYEQPRNLREFLEEPNHSQGYTVGLQWVGDPMWRHGRARLQSEFTFLQQDASFFHRYTGSWYTSRAAIQGYTHEGQVLGAGIGPGSSSQWIALEYLAPSWMAGLNAQRIRWLEDVHAQRWWGEKLGFCEHDVSSLAGARAGGKTPWGEVIASYSQGWRVNTFFENYATGCPQNVGRNHWGRTITVTVTPGARVLGGR